jgi:hypothetical protein
MMPNYARAFNECLALNFSQLTINMQDITKDDLARGRKLKLGAVAAPVFLTLLPAIITFVLLLLATGGPPAAAVVLFLGIIATVIGFVTGIVIAAVLGHKHSVWSKEMRNRMAARGVRAEEVNWFKNELKSNEKRALRSISARDLLLADAYRETLASRLTASRIIKSSRRELQFAKQRQNSIKQLKSARAEDFGAEIAKDIDKIGAINEEAKLMLSEAESRLRMIEAASSREGHLADSEIALKKLSTRTSELPLALEAAKMTEEIRRELEQEDIEEPGNSKA